jgi:hypothetical protein
MDDNEEVMREAIEVENDSGKAVIRRRRFIY